MSKKKKQQRAGRFMRKEHFNFVVPEDKMWIGFINFNAN